MTAPPDAPSALLDEALASFAERVAAIVVRAIDERLESRSPWMTKDEAIERSRLPRGTFEKVAADGRIPSHGGKTKIFHRDELDDALRRM